MSISPARGTSYRLGRECIRIVLDDPAVAALVDFRYRRMRVDDGAPAMTARIFARREEISIERAGLERRYAFDAAPTIAAGGVAGIEARAMFAVNREAFMRQPIVALHAACVVVRGRAVILAGASHAGKTTLALTLLALDPGALLLSDEYAVYDPRSGVVHAFPRHVSIRPDTAMLLASEGLTPCGAPELERFADERWTDAAPAGAVFVLEQRAKQPAVRPMTSGEAVLRLFPHAIGAEYGLRFLDRLAPSCERLQVAMVHTGSPRATALALLAAARG